MHALVRPEPGPGTLKITRWGGRRLAALRGGPELRDQPVGESWEFSTLAGSESCAGGRPLRELLGGPLPFLAKLIDTALPLSIQVHPGDRPDPAAPHITLPGKEEAWVVLAADPGARLQVGLRPGLTPGQLAAAARAGAPLLTCLQDHLAEPGLVVLVPAGTVHAIGGGLLLAEIQQPADCTYRLYDYDSGRPLHLEQALAAADLRASPRLWRPRDAPTRLRGEHVELDIFTAGAHRLAPNDAPALLIGASGHTHVRLGDERDLLAPGDLLLARAGALALDVPAGGLVVVGRVHP